MKFAFFICFLLYCGLCRAQDTLTKKPVWGLSGYLKDMAWCRFEGNFSNAAVTNLVHNRLNLKWNPSESLSARLEIRNRFYWGDDVRNIPNFKESLDNGNQYADLSGAYLKGSSSVAHSSVERLWLEYKKKKWNLRLGRQRINWGLNNTWNPNDLFNTYNFLDFDYEERPGSDAVKGQYLISNLSNLELAFAATKHHSIIAAKYFTNYRRYDLQGILGYYDDKLTAGMGWAGSIKDVGFKGEAQYYSGTKDTSANLIVSLEGDYVFRKGWYCSSSVLYNHRGINQRISNFYDLSFQVSPQNLMPAKWTFMASSSKEFTPLFSGTMTLVYSPVIDMLIVFPSFRYNLKRNLDLDFVWQSFFVRSDVFRAFSHSSFLRLKCSF